MTEGMDNIIPILGEPDNYWCKIVEYSWSHKVLNIELNHFQSKQPQRYCLTFSGTKYFSGPVEWSGAYFKVPSLEERKTFFKWLFPEKLQVIENSQDGYWGL